MVDSVDCGAVLADARASGSLAELKTAVELCKGNHFSGPQVQKAKTECARLEAREQLFSAQQGQSYRLVQKRLKRAQHWLSKQEVQAAQDIIKRLQSVRRLEEVRNSKSPALIRNVGASALKHGVKNVSEVLHKADQLDALQALSLAKLEGSHEDIIASYDAAESLGIKNLEVKAACTLSRLAQDAEDTAALRRACVHATKVEVAEPLIASGQQLLQQQDANAELRKVLDSDDVREIEKACEQGPSAGASASLIEAARKRLELLASPSPEPLPVQQHVQAVFQIGQTEVHNKLGPLLAKALLAHAASEGPLQQDGEQSLARALDKLLSHRHSRFYSLDGDAEYAPKGGRPYFKPKGWVRYSLHINDFDKVHDWCVAYHGTSKMNTIKIMMRGLRQRGEEGVAEAHGQAGSLTGKSIYLSPSIEYAGHPVYAEFFKLAENHWAQLVFQCRVKPGTFTERAGTLGGKHWRRDLTFDPNFESWEGLEWLIENPDDVRATGLLVREFGPSVDERTYGHVNTLVKDEHVEWESPDHLGVSHWHCGDGPQFSWTRLRQASFADQGWFIV